MSKRKILIIENQFTQFKEIIKLLDRAGYESFPDEKTFKTFLDWIRIYLNPRYSKDRQNDVLGKVLERINEFKPDLFIIDHILVGNHTAKDGIDLAIKFRENEIKKPFVFFSRTEMNNIDICDKLPMVMFEKEWIFKGYSGADILEERFFEYEVIPRIEALLKKNLSNHIIDKLNENKPKLISTTTSIQRDIALITQKLIGQINEGNVKLNNELLSQLSENLLDSKYLALLTSKLTNQ